MRSSIDGALDACLSICLHGWLVGKLDVMPATVALAVFGALDCVGRNNRIALLGGCGYHFSLVFTLLLIECLI